MKISWTCSTTKSTHIPTSEQCLRMFFASASPYPKKTCCISRHVSPLFLNFLKCEYGTRGGSEYIIIQNLHASFGRRKVQCFWERVIIYFVRARHDFNGLCWKAYLLRTSFPVFSFSGLSHCRTNRTWALTLEKANIFRSLPDKGLHELLM